MEEAILVDVLKEQNDKKLAILNGKKVEGFNLIRQIANANNQLRAMNEVYGKLSQEIAKLEQEFIADNEKLDKK